MNFTAAKALVPNGGADKDPVLNRDVPPDDFLEVLVAWAASEDASVFAPNNLLDIYAVVEGSLGGPWPGDLTPPGPIPWIQRRAVMCEVLRVLGGFESSWNWNEGADPDGSDESDPMCQETGVFQVSANSMDLNDALGPFVIAQCGADDAQTFIAQMKADHRLALGFCARLLRCNITWDGPISRGEVQQWLSVSAMEEFQQLLAQQAQGGK